MESCQRQIFNQKFTPEKYLKLNQLITAAHNYKPAFRIAETPIFLTPELHDQLLEACEEISETLLDPDFKQKSQAAILPNQEVPGEDEHTTFLQLDFGICDDGNGKLIPQLIEIQGFPTLYFFQELLGRSYKAIYDIPDNYSSFFGGINTEDYFRKLRNLIVGNSHPENVVLLEIDPKNQATAIDFFSTNKILKTPVKCISEIKKSGKDLFYVNDQGKKIGVEKIYNRIIFDELERRPEFVKEYSLTDEVNAKFIGHPHWFSRISKHTMPLIKSKYNPYCSFLSDLQTIPDDLHNYVLKPLFSFSGSGVIINVTKEDIEKVSKPEHFILQKKVNYQPAIQTINEPAKCEIRMLMIWEKGAARPEVVNNLVRLSKGEMVGVKYNRDKDWVGASVALHGGQ